MPLGVEALSTALLTDEERIDGCALINFGATTTTLAIYADGVLHQLLVVPLGGKNITKDIQELGISEANAEKLKFLKGSALRHLVEKPIRIQIPSAEDGNSSVKIETDFLATIIEARLSEIITPILRAIDKTPFSLNAGIVISGGGSKLNNIVDFLEEKTGMDVRFGDHSDWLSEDSDPRFADPIYAQQIGSALLLHEYKKENQETEKVVESKKEQRKGNSFWDKIKDSTLKLFEDENYLKDDKTLKKTK
jgi:cell division protein FtsA